VILIGILFLVLVVIASRRSFGANRTR